MGAMTKRCVCFLGGTGVISAASVALAADRGWQVSVVNRGLSTGRSLPEGVESIVADVRDPASLNSAIAGRHFDAVCDFLSFTPDQVAASVRAFRQATDQYVFVSSASAYQKPPRILPITEATTLANPFWSYSRDKIACETYLFDLWRAEQFGVTVVRPSHTYDKTMTILGGRHATIRRLLTGQEIVIHGDGSSLWTLTHTTDFAKGFVGLLGNRQALGLAVHITSDEWLTWDAIAQTLADAAGMPARIVHVPSDAINAADPDWGAGLLGDKAHPTIFDNSLIRRLVPDFTCTVPFSQGAREIVDHYRAFDGTYAGEGETEAIIGRLLDRYRVS